MENKNKNPQAATPLKILGTQFSHIVLYPNNGDVEASTPVEATPSPADEELKTNIETLQSELSKITKERDTLKKTLTEIELSSKKEKVCGIITKRVELGLAKKEDTENLTEAFMKLGEEQLDIMASDLTALEKNKPEAFVSTPSEEETQLSDKEAQLKKVKAELFGHEDLLEGNPEKAKAVWDRLEVA